MRNRKEGFVRRKSAPKLERRTAPVTLFPIGEILKAKGQVPSLVVNDDLKGKEFDPKKLNYSRESVVIREPYYSDGIRNDDGVVEGLIWTFSSRRPSLVTQNLGESLNPLFNPRESEKFTSKK